MRNLPSGIVTFLFTDVEGSTRLLNELGDAYADVLAEHRRVLRTTFSRYGGLEVDTQGDAFFVAFSRASDALAAAYEAQQQLQGAPVRVRIGVHTGEPIVTDEGYVGAEVHEAARIAAAAHGGQVVVSEQTARLAERRAGPRLIDVGLHRLKDLTGPKRLYQLGEGEFPPLRTLNRTNLPVQRTALIGRRRELRELADLLARPEVRLVTLTGPAGTGKTRLALELAAEAASSFSAGVFFVGLAVVREAARVLPTLAQTLGVEEQPGETLAETLSTDLRDKELLLLLDNFEHVEAAALDVGDLLAAASKLKLLVTSRMPLHLAGEREYAVFPLREDDALELFVERARAVKSDFSLNRDRLVVAEICRRLDHLPLAVELAAARVKLLPPAALLHRLNERLKLLTGGARDLDERQRTLRAAIDWSYDLLSEEERLLFARLSVFVGGWTIEAAEAVCATAGLEIFDGLTSLLDKSLIRQRAVDGEARFSMLETLREYASERLDAAEGASEVRRRHAEYFRERATTLAPVLRTGSDEGRHAMDVIDHDVENFRVALTWLMTHSEFEGMHDVLSALANFWFRRAQPLEAVLWLDRLLEHETALEAATRARVLNAAARFAGFAGERARATALAESALTAARTLGDRRTVAWAALTLGGLVVEHGEPERARALLEESVTLFKDPPDDAQGLTLALHARAMLARGDGDLEAAERDLDAAVRLAREEQTLSAAPLIIAAADVRLECEEVAQADALYREGLRLSAGGATAEWIPRGLAGLAVTKASKNELFEAGRCWGAAQALEDERDRRRSFALEEYEQRLTVLRKQGARSFDAGMREGRRANVGEVIARALRLDHPADQRKTAD